LKLRRAGTVELLAIDEAVEQIISLVKETL
jgi:hypothetical protein